MSILQKTEEEPEFDAGLYLPDITYTCIFEVPTRRALKKGRKEFTFSDMRRYSGVVKIEGNEYRVEFADYDATLDLLEGKLATKATMVATYKEYFAGISLVKGEMFGPVLEGDKGTIGRPALISKGGFDWLVYATLTRNSLVHISLDFGLIEPEMKKVVPLLSLKTKPGELVHGIKQKHRWIWAPYAPGRPRGSAKAKLDLSDHACFSMPS